MTDEANESLILTNSLNPNTSGNLNQTIIKILQDGVNVKRLDDTDLAVQIESAYKSYNRKQHVLKDLNLNVPRGAIYGLLGPSGCGKTTILRSVVGRLSLDSGRVTVLGKEPGSKGHLIPGRLVGYMPQEIALYNEFNIAETLHYFGLLHDMPGSEIEKRRDFLVEFLDLPSKSRLIKNLSGGQKRRVSMAIALLQEPKLLILDEPTVGVDPLLREKIWSHLIDISKLSQTSIIITTHYIEEARKADRVGLIRGGKILAENSPDHLLSIYEESSLENVFLKLCINDATKVGANFKIENGLKNPNYENKVAHIDINNNTNEDSSPAGSEGKYRKTSAITKIQRNFSRAFRMPKLKNYLGILYKDSILIRRNIAFLFFQFLIPVIQISLTCLCVGHEPYNLNFGIVNNESNKTSNNHGSLLFINQMSNRTFNKQYLNWSEAYTRTREGKLWGFVDMGENFTQDTLDKFSSLEPSNASLIGSNVNTYLDTTSQQIALIVQAKLMESYQTFLKKFSHNFPIPLPPEFFDSPVVIKPPIYGDLQPQFINYMAPGIMITIMFTITIGLTGLMFVVEKKEGLLDRSLVAGVHTIEIMLAHITAKLAIMIVQITLLVLISTLVFEIDVHGPVLLASFLLLLQGFCGMSYGLALSAGSDDETQVLQTAIGSVFPAMIMSGIIWPLEGMPEWVKYISYLSPMTFSGEAMRSVVSRGWGLDYSSIWLGIGTSVGWSLLFNVVALVLFNI